MKNMLADKKIQIKLIAMAGAGIAGFIMSGHIIAIPVGAALGFYVPMLIERIQYSIRMKKFCSQIPDAIMLITSCLKAGLSLNQSMEVLVQEMPDPISTEFQHVTRSLRVGVSLEEAFITMGEKMNQEELNFVFSAVLIARETGGDLPNVLTKLVDTLRDRRKLKESIDTFTIQGRAQAFIMGLIPPAFVFMSLQQDPHHFDIMLATETGRLMIAAAIVLQIVAVFFIIKVSQIKI